MKEEKKPRQYFYQLKENEESQVVNHNLCLIANPFACEQDSQKTDLSITHTDTLWDSLRKPDKKTCRKHIMYKLCNALWRKRK